MRKINRDDIIILLISLVFTFIIAFWIGWFKGRNVGFNKGVKVTAKYADSLYQDNLNQCDSILKQAVFYRNMYREKYDSLNHKSK